MSKENAKPQIRFKGFSEVWEQYKTKDLCSISTGKSNTQDRVEDGIYPFYVRSSIIERSNRYLFDEEAVLTVGDGVGTGKVFHYVNGKYDLHQRVYRMFDFSNEIIAKYFYYYFSNNFYDRVMAMTAKTSVDSVRYEMIADMDIVLPKVQEQKDICIMFEKLDNLITFYQRKYDKLNKIKKSMLEKMFPKNGSNVPEIRFKGFTGDWEQRKLGEISSILSGFMGDSLLADGLYHLTRIETIADGKVNESHVGYSNKKPDDIYLLNEGDILYSNINSITHMGKVAKYQGKSRLYHGINLLRLMPTKDIDSNFLFYLLNTEEKRNWAKTRANQAVSQASINQSLLATQEMRICSIDEQYKIGEYFDRLDHLLTLHQRKLEKLKNIKQSMLEKMFV